jgi:hypothetical protein
LSNDSRVLFTCNGGVTSLVRKSARNAHPSRIDLQLPNLGAEHRPGEGRVDADDVSALEDVLPGAVHLRERDERAPQILATMRAQLEQREIVVQRFCASVSRASSCCASAR